MNKNYEDILRVVIEATSKASRRSVSTEKNDISARFDQLGIDSVSIFSVQVKIEDAFGVTLEDGFLFEFKTPELCATEIYNRINAVEK